MITKTYSAWQLVKVRLKEYTNNLVQTYLWYKENELTLELLLRLVQQ